ncbi:ubiquitin-like-specific protease 1A [Coffea arabica]|uniref:Ubiquitin-like-specific protease 1A n=1 Tax=Coffea arabica TaxID=13443 RepID=A0A6P6TD40_COFAR
MDNTEKPVWEDKQNRRQGKRIKMDSSGMNKCQTKMVALLAKETRLASIGEKLSEGRAKILKFLFDTQMSQGEVLVSIKGQTASRDAMGSLLPQKPMACDIINCYCAMKTARQQRRAVDQSMRWWFMPTWFQQEILEFNKSADELYCTYLQECKVGGNIKKCEKIFVQIWHDEHWYMCVVDMGSEEVLIYDSMREHEQTDMNRRSSVEIVIERLETALTYGLEGQYSSCLWLNKIKAAATCPQQRNAWDCGLFMLKYMDMLSSGIGSWK